MEALLRMRRALREYQVRGIKTNIPFHQWILRHPRFMAGDLNTAFIDDEHGSRRKEELFPHRHVALASAAIAALHREEEQALQVLQQSANEKSEWRETGKRESLQRAANLPIQRTKW